MHLILAILATSGLLLVKSEPSGANIIVDSVSNGETPRLVTGLDADIPHKLILRKAGYRDAEVRFKFNGRVPVCVSEKLVLDSGIIKINTEPQGAEVTVNGVVRGKSPLLVRDVPKGRSTVKIKLDGFKDVVEGISVNAGDEQTLNFVLSGLPGTLALSSVPHGARFYLNGVPKGQGPLVLAGLDPGEYEVRAELDGYDPETRRISLDGGGAKSEEFILVNNQGRLEVRTSPAGASVIFDGVNLGTTVTHDEMSEFSDVFHINNVASGEHTLVVRKDGYGESVRHPRIKTGKTSKANVRLKRAFVPNVEITTLNGKVRGVLVRNSPEYMEIEVSMGVVRPFPKSDIRKVEYLDGK